MSAKNKTKKMDWWKDKDFINELDKRYADYKSGKAKAFTIEESKKEIQRILNKQKMK